MRRTAEARGWLLPRGRLAPLGAIVLAGATVRFATLGLQSSWTDEVATASYVQGSLKQLLTLLPVTDANPPFFYLLEWVTVRVFGQGDVGVQVLAAEGDLLESHASER